MKIEELQDSPEEDVAPCHLGIFLLDFSLDHIPLAIGQLIKQLEEKRG